MSRFKKKESYLHKCATEVLSSWVNGVIEKPFYIDGVITFVPDVTVYEGRILTAFYEVVNTHSVNGKKLGFIQEWCFRNQTEVSVYEVSADYILAQTEKPDQIRTRELYEISVL